MADPQRSTMEKMLLKLTEKYYDEKQSLSMGYCAQMTTLITNLHIYATQLETLLKKKGIEFDAWDFKTVR